MSVINTNIKSLVAQGALARNNRDLATAMERLSTGSRINSAADDAAGLSIATRMTSQVRGLQMAIKNANDAISVADTAEGAMTEVSDILQRMRELAVQASSDSNSDVDRGYLDLEVQQLAAEIDRIATTTQFNGINILDGTFLDKSFQIGANSGQQIAMSVGSMKISDLGVGTSQASTSTATAASVSSGSITSDVNAEGGAAVATTASLLFNDARMATTVSEDTYGFDVTDGVVTASFGAMSVNFSSQLSKDAFLTALNSVLETAHVDTTLTGSGLVLSGSGATTMDITSAANRDALKFDARVGGGEVLSMDIYDRLITNGVTTTAVTGAQLAAAVEDELQAAYDLDVTVALSAATDKLTITDAQGRRIEVGQGAGSGYLFGTDVSNSGTLVTVASERHGITAAWGEGDNDEIIFTNSTGGKIEISSFTGSASNSVAFHSDSIGGVYEPVLIEGTAQRVLADQTFQPEVEPTKIAINFGAYNDDSSSANYNFKITDGNGNVWADWSATALEIGDNTQNAQSETIRNYFSVALASGVGASGDFTADSTISISEFDIEVDRGTVIITNTKGRALQVVETGGITAGVTASISVTNLNNFSGTEQLYSSVGTSGTAPNLATRTSEIAKGQAYAATEVAMTMSEDDATFDFSLNGVFLSSGTSTVGGTQATWTSTESFATSSFKTSLDAMVRELNTAQSDNSAVSYTVDGRTITFFHMDGGPLTIGDYKSGAASPNVRFNLTAATGQGVAQELYYEGHNVVTTASATGTSAVETRASLQLGGSDSYAFAISDGENEYQVDATAFTMGSYQDADAMADALERALVGSGIGASVSAGGEVTLSRTDGGAIYLTSMTAANGTGAVWTPTVGQGTATSVAGSGEVAGVSRQSVSSGATSSRSSQSVAVASISVGTTSDAADAIAVVDSALDYVNLERSKLGAISNRLQHTIDNLSNVISATQASRSRVLDTDYAAETAELARAQIIQQAATAMLAQANQQPQTVLALLQ